MRISIFTKKANDGSQPKWHIGNDWYKMDDWGYEGLAETVCSDMLEKSNLDGAAHYEPEIIEYGLKKKPGSRSDSFVLPGETLIYTNMILDRAGTNLGELVRNSSDTESAIKTYLGYVKKYTDLDYSSYLCKMLEFDDLTANSDRNGGNMSFIRGENGKYYPVMYDNGRAFNTRDMMLHPDRDPAWRGRTTDAIPFSTLSYEQAHAAEKICGGTQLTLWYGKEDLERSLDKCRGIYPDEVIDVCRKGILAQMRDHQKYFTPEVQKEFENDEVLLRYGIQQHRSAEEALESQKRGISHDEVMDRLRDSSISDVEKYNSDDFGDREAEE